MSQQDDQDGHTVNFICFLFMEDNRSIVLIVLFRKKHL